MKVIRDDLWLCDDCLFYAVNGDTSGIDDPQRERDVIEGVNALGPHLVPDFDSEAPEDVDEDNGIEEFSWKPCDACGTRLGGGRHRFAVLGEEKKRKKDRPRIGGHSKWSRQNPLPGFLSDYSGGELALMVAGVGVLGYIAYRIWDANFSSDAQSAEAWAVSGGSPTGVGQFVNQNPGFVGPAVGTTNYQDFPQGAYIDTNPGAATPTDETPNLCGNTPGAAYCWVDQGNTNVPAQGDLVALMAQPAGGGEPVAVYGRVYGSTDASGNIGGMDSGNNVRVYFKDPYVDLHSFPLSYVGVGALDLIGAAAGF